MQWYRSISATRPRAAEMINSIKLISGLNLSNLPSIRTLSTTKPPLSYNSTTFVLVNYLIKFIMGFKVVFLRRDKCTLSPLLSCRLSLSVFSSRFPWCLCGSAGSNFTGMGCWRVFVFVGGRGGAGRLFS